MTMRVTPSGAIAQGVRRLRPSVRPAPATGFLRAATRARESMSLPKETPIRAEERTLDELGSGADEPDPTRRHRDELRQRRASAASDGGMGGRRHVPAPRHENRGSLQTAREPR